MALCLFLIYLVFSLVVIYRAIPVIVWEVGSVIYLLFGTLLFGMTWWLFLPLLVIIVGLIALIHLEPMRISIADFIYSKIGNVIPKLSQTEEEALNAGDVWLERDIFVGEPNWDTLAAISTELTPDEQSFMDNEVQTVCSMLNEWNISQARDLPEHVWTYLKDNGFFGLVITKEFGGKGFSARAHSDIVMKIASRSGVAAVTVMVPNSLGPGELLHFYGTDEQKSYYLPRLAKGIDIPCFALTEPTAGSDATSIQSSAIVLSKIIDGKSVLGLNLTLNKRWITLAPIATLIGLAVNLRDPDGLLQGEGLEGITCILIDRDTPNLVIGNRHLAADQPFMNGTVRGENIFVPITSIIGGQKMAGKGWQMLVECLSIGRSISLPALGAASSSVAYLTTGAFARIRKQFNVEIGQFEGVEEKLAEIAGLNYLITSTRLLTVAAVNAHKKPSVASAITKYFNTELARTVVTSGMDVHAGRAVVVGPRNYMTNYYQGVPISITVEGANIMSRNLLIFGQGSMACHPFIRDEFYAIRSQDKVAFRSIIWNHIAYSVRNFAKALCSAWTGGIFITPSSNVLAGKQKSLVRLSHAFAWFADLSLIYLGADLKRKERLSARLADAMSYLYMAMGALRNCQGDKANVDRQLHAEWAMTYCLYNAQKAMLSFCENFPFRPLGFLMRIVAFPFGQTMLYPSDKLDHQLARLMTTNNQYRDSLKQTIYLSGDASQSIDKMEQALQLIISSHDLYKKISDLKRVGVLDITNQLQQKVDKKEITVEEMQQILKVEKARWDAIQVDEFTFDSMKNQYFNSVTNDLKTPFD